MDRRVNLSSANSSQILADSLLDFVKDTADMPTNSDESKLPSTLVSNLSINENGYIWKGNLPQLKRFVQNDLKLIGKWSWPGGETKLFLKNTEISLEWFGQTRKKLIIEKDTKANLITNTLNSLCNEAVLNITNSAVMTCEGLVDNKAEPAPVEPELSVIWTTIKKLQDTILVHLNQVTSGYDIKLSRIEAELNKVRFEYESKIDALNIKYTELLLEQDSKNGFESKLNNVELEVVNLKADIQKLQCENNFLKDILQSD